MYLSQLPNSQHYQALSYSPEPDTFMWEDKQTPLLKIITPSRDPWNKKWAIKIIRDKDPLNPKIPINLIIRCFYPGRAFFLPVIIVRKEFHSQYMISQDDTLQSYGFLINSNQDTRDMRFWLGYFFKKQGYRT